MGTKRLVGLCPRVGTPFFRVNHAVSSHGAVTLQANESLTKRKPEWKAIRAKCREFELASFNNAIHREEQERELSPENEQERQVERPLALTPCNHSLHRDVKRFVHQGILDRDSDAFQPAFELFSNTSAMEWLEVEAWSVHLLVTADFARTVHATGHQHLDSFLRPVHWVVSGKGRNTIDCVVLSPFEAHALSLMMVEMTVSRFSEAMAV
ncbi:MAG: hypothetical protein L6R40_008642 [Gallowayella cf. fulva]|nr:MAG: hypothetical protein L6R40_008642 [Xanthomendoza cf. fulva]